MLIVPYDYVPIGTWQFNETIQFVPSDQLDIDRWVDRRLILPLNHCFLHLQPQSTHHPPSSYSLSESDLPTPTHLPSSFFLTYHSIFSLRSLKLFPFSLSLSRGFSNRTPTTTRHREEEDEQAAFLGFQY